jgi:hypothetical protein
MQLQILSNSIPSLFLSFSAFVEYFYELPCRRQKARKNILESQKNEKA